MEYLMTKTYTGDYGGKSYKAWPVSFEVYLRNIADVSKDESEISNFGTVNAIVKRQTPWPLRWFRTFRSMFDTHVMVLDCDGTDEMLAASHMLATDGIGFALIQSSPSHYWIVTDFIAPLDDVLVKMRTIPGADTEHIEMCEKFGIVAIRGVALPGRVPIFQEPDSLTNPHSLTFYYELQKLYQHAAIARRLKAEFMRQAIKDKNMGSLASDPEFQL